MSDASPGRRLHRSTAALLAVATGLIAALLLPAAAPALADVDASDTCGGARVLPAGTWHTEPLSSAGDVDWYQFSTSGTVRVLITLGGLDADDRLDLYSACGTLLASSNRPGGQYEEFYRALPPGTFHLRVQRASGPSSTDPYGLRLKLLSYTVQVLSSSGWLEFSDEPRIVGEVLNNTATPREDIRVRIRFYDAADGLLRAGDTYARLERLPAWSRSMFVWSAETIAGFDHYTVQVVDAPTASDRPFTALTVTPGPATPDGFGGVTFNGTLNNPTAQAVGVPRVMLTIYDAYGRVSNADFNDTSPDPMAAHSSNPYAIYLSGHASGNRMVFSTHGYPQ
jgi:hypothetical protein